MKTLVFRRFFAPCAIATLVFASGCARLPEPVAASNGQPLSVREETKTHHYTVQEKVGEVQYKNEKGEKVGTANVYQERQKTEQYQVWNAYQGNAQISDDDLYRIAHDKKAEDEVREKRESGVFLNRLGLGTLVVGALAAGTGYFLMSQQKTPEPDARGATPSPSFVPMGVFYGGLVTVSVGSILTYVGLRKAHSEHPLDQNRATQAADSYNGILAGRSAATTTTTGSTR